MKPFDLPRVTARPRAVRGAFYQPRARVVSRRNPFAVDWSRVFVAALVGAVIVIGVAL